MAFSAVIKCETEMEVRKGDSILLTAGTGMYEVWGKCEALFTRIPYQVGEEK